MAATAMGNIHVGRYEHPETHGNLGWIEPDNKGWIAFIRSDGVPVFFLERDPETGAVIGHPDAKVGTRQPGEPDYRPNWR